MNTAEKLAIESSIAKRLNAAKRLNPTAVINRLNIPTALIGEDITVTVQSGYIWAGSTTQEYSCKIGSTAAEAEETLKSKGL